MSKKLNCDCASKYMNMLEKLDQLLNLSQERIKLQDEQLAIEKKLSKLFRDRLTEEDLI